MRHLQRPLRNRPARRVPAAATAVALAVFAAAAPAAGAAPVRNVAVPMRDGVALQADFSTPDGDGPFPVLVYRTPYGRTEASRFTIVGKAVARGYAIVVQDVRGRYGSQGEFEPYRNEGRDGYDTIEWAAAQPWSNGSVGTFGLSYPGAVQWLAAVESPPHLKAMVPAMTFSTPRNFFYSGGVFDLSWIGWIWNNIAPDARVKKGLAGPKTVADARAEWARAGDRMRRTLPLSGLAELRDVAPYYFEWMHHPPGDPWWHWAEIRGRYDRVSAAVLNLSGWHDEAYGPEGAITNFLGMAGSPRGGGRAQLVIGPWSHGVESVGQTRFGRRDHGPAARLDYDELVLRFMDHHVRGLDNGVDREPRVRMFVMGEGRWIAADSWPVAGRSETTFYLHTGRGRGRLTSSAPTSKASSSSFESNPARPVVDRFAADQGAYDYRDLVKRRDVVAFETPPLAADLRVVGAMTAEIFVSSDAPDTDLWAKVYDVAPDGTAYNLMNPGLDVVRASYRDGGPERKLLKPDQAVALRFENLLTGNLFRKGHRVRLALMTSFFPHFSQNLHTGELEVDSSAGRRARIRIHHDAAHPSRLVLPVLP